MMAIQTSEVGVSLMSFDVRSFNFVWVFKLWNYAALVEVLFSYCKI